MNKENYRQEGIPTGHRYDSVYDKLRPVYKTFIRNGNTWEYIGKCFDGESVSRGYNPKNNIVTELTA